MDEEDQIGLFENYLNNITKKIEFENSSYYLLVKRQSKGDHSIIFLTDSAENFWVKKISISVLERIKEEMKIQTTIKNFTEHLAFGMKTNCSLQNLFTEPELMVKIRITEGLTMNCLIEFDTNINIHKRFDSFLTINRLYGKQLYEANELKFQNFTESKDMLKAKEAVSKKIENKNESESREGIRSLLKPDNPLNSSKGRDLINPTRKKRIRKGAKIGGSSRYESEQHSELSDS